MNYKGKVEDWKGKTVEKIMFNCSTQYPQKGYTSVWIEFTDSTELCIYPSNETYLTAETHTP